MNQAWLLAAGASIGAFWSQVKNVFHRIGNIFFIEVKLNPGAVQSCQSYLTKHAWSSPLNTRSFSFWHLFIRPKSRKGHVVVEDFGSTTFFIYKHRPIWISGAEDGIGSTEQLKSSGSRPDSGGRGGIRALRFGFNIESLLTEAASWSNELYWKELERTANKRKHRFSIYRVYGRSGDRDDHAEISGKTALDDSHTMDFLTFQTSRVLGWQFEELNFPQPENAFGALAYPESVNNFIEILKKWRQSEKWYQEHMVPWRLGALLYGGPGTGKTSFVRAIAQELDLPIYVFDLTTLSNQELTREWARVMNNSPAIVLFEDMDRLFDENREFKPNKQQQMNKPSLTLDTLLNCISGVEPSDGILAMVTVNDLNKLDTALGVPNDKGETTRPGRLDFSLKFDTLTLDSRRKIAARILNGYESEANMLCLAYENDTGAQFTKRCSDLALKLYWANEKANANL